MSKANYPLLLRPHLAERVWGGNRLGDGIGEAWDLSVHPNGPCTIENGALAGRTLADVSAKTPDDFGGAIDLLAKRLDAKQDLSVQVHPKKGADSKTEAWIVLQSDRGAGVYHGFSQPIEADALRDKATDGSLPEVMQFVQVRPGQCVFVPSGTVHAIGAGLFLFEIQQSADVTYRLFDWGRGRELHLEQGVACSDLNGAPPLPPARPQSDGSLRLVECDHFRVDRMDSHKPFHVEPGDRWTAVLVVAGSVAVDDIDAQPGQTVLLPTAAGARTFSPSPCCTALIYGP
ncbi:MAG: class I mannose-6-phosphate isomerase [Planctomycetota bacterium]|nr:class I mannose-6-phosphate isomerase [Planctomycetota bacterium]